MDSLKKQLGAVWKHNTATKFFIPNVSTNSSSGLWTKSPQTGRSSITGTAACITVIYNQSQLKLFKVIGVISHICWRAGNGLHGAPVN